MMTAPAVPITVAGSNPANDFRGIRLKLGYTPLEWGRALGYRGTDRTVQIMIYQFETGLKPIPNRTALLERDDFRFDHTLHF